MLDPMECDHARLARDAAYDGRFYTGVRTTGVYCRPVRPAQSRNVRFFPSAGAAEAVPAVFGLPSRDGAVLAGLEWLTLDSGARIAAYWPARAGRP